MLIQLTYDNLNDKNDNIEKEDKIAEGEAEKF